MTAKQYLTGTLQIAFDELARSLEGVTARDSRWGARADWRRYPYGVGLDGSVAGIVHHVAAWKNVAADGLENGSFPSEESVRPPGPGWEGLLSWLHEGQARLVRILGGLTDADLEREMEFFGEAMPVHQILTLFIQHDSYHAGQINLLRQQMGHQFDE